MRAQREREAETQAEGEAGSTHGTLSRVPRITPQAAGGAKPLCHRSCPVPNVYIEMEV